jgi:hypothetical protein
LELVGDILPKAGHGGYRASLSLNFPSIQSAKWAHLNEEFSVLLLIGDSSGSSSGWNREESIITS